MTKTSKTTYVATTPDGQEFTRNSARAYSHAVLVRFHNDEKSVVRGWGYLSFNSSEALATKEANKWRQGGLGVTYADGDTFDEVLVVAVSTR